MTRLAILLAAFTLTACANQEFVATAVAQPVSEATVDPGADTPDDTPMSGPVASGTTPARRMHNAARMIDEEPEPEPVDGDCASWAPWFAKYGLPWSEFESIAWRESNCSHVIADRPSTGDLSAGIVQTNFYGGLAAMWEASGWSWEMVRDDPEAAVAAAGALYRMCGGLGPWTPPYSCSGNVLPSPTEMGYGP